MYNAFKIPSFFEKIFDLFPLFKYHDFLELDIRDKGNSKKNFFFGHKNNKKESKFILGSFNIIDFSHKNSGVKYIPSDPISLGYALIFCKHYEHILPNDKQNEKSNNLLTILSPYASPNRTYFLAIEENSYTRVLKTQNELMKELTENCCTETSEQYLVISKVVDDIQDLWILCLACEKLDLETLNKVFFVSEEIKLNKIINRIVVSDLINQIYRSKDFQERHSDFLGTRSFMNCLKKSIVNKSIEFFPLFTDLKKDLYSVELEKFELNLNLITDFVTKKNTETNTRLDTFLLLKIVGLVVIFDYVLPHTKLGKIICKRPILVEKCYEIINKY